MNTKAVKIKVPLVLISTSTFGRVSERPLSELREAQCTLRLNPYGRRLEPEESKELLSGVNGLIAGTERLDREILSSASNLRVISRVGSGTENVDLEAAHELGIEVTSTPEAPSRAVAELSLAGILASLRHLCEADHAVRQARWEKPMGRLLSRRTVGVIGTGRVGRSLIGLLGPFGCRLLACDTSPDPSWARSQAVEYISIDDLVEAADVVSLHVPLTADTRHLLDRKRIERMKPGALLVNCARGGLVDEAALAENLSNGRLGGAYLDVFESEPYSGTLIDAPNTVLSPHIGSYASECRLEMELQAAANLIRVLATESEPA